MMTLDSISICMEIENLDFDKSKYALQTEEYQGSFLQKYVMKDYMLPLGFKRIEIWPNSNEVRIQCSAKILKENYLRGINSNTVEQLYDVVVQYVCCSFDNILNAKVFKVDITKNLIFDDKSEKESVLQSLLLGKSNANYWIEDYLELGQGVVFKGKQKSYKNRIIYYNKAVEMYLLKNKEILSCVKRGADFHLLSKILRVELNLEDFERIKKAIGKENPYPHKPKDCFNEDGSFNKGIVRGYEQMKADWRGAVSLKEILESDADPISIKHQDIMKYANDITIFDIYDDFNTAWKHSGFEKMLNEDFNGEIDLMLDFAKRTMTKTSYWRKRREILEWYAWHLSFHKDHMEKGKYLEGLAKLNAKILENVCG